MRAMLLIAGLLVAAPLMSGVALADTKDGVDAWERGDYKAAVDQWRAAAAKGDPDAMFNLGQAYKLGRGVPADSWKAQDYYRQASEKGHDVAADNYGLALFQNGRPREAIPYLEKASERGDARAQYILGTMLFNGIDIKTDWVRAYALLTRSDRSGLPQAKSALTQMEQHVSADERRKGVAMADRMATPPPAPPVAVASTDGGTTSGVRGFDPAPSKVAEKPAKVSTPVAGVPAPPKPVTRPTPAPVSAPPPAAVAASGSWRVQLGAFGNGDNARKLGLQMAPKFPGQTVDYVAAGALTKVLVGRYPSRAAAVAACGSVKPCVPVGP